MKRDMDLVRRMLLVAEEQPHGEWLLGVDGIDADTFAAHVQWLLDAGFVEGRVTEMAGFAASRIERLTWQGCEFLDAARNETLWVRAKEVFCSNMVSFPLSLLKDWLEAEIKRSLPGLGG